MEYLNGRECCPRALWPEEPVADADRCQHAFSEHARCGLPGCSDGSDGLRRCLVHTRTDRDPQKLRSHLEALVACGARLWDAQLAGADLLGAKLKDAQLMDADLRGARLVNADLRNADLSDADLSDADLRFADLSGANLTDALLEGKPDLRRANLAGATLTGVQMDPTCKLAHAVWSRDDRFTIDEERRAKQELRGGNNARAFELFNSASTVYRQIKQAYQDAGDHQTGGHFFVREMECRRALLRIETEDSPAGRLWERALWWLMHHTCGYGEWPGRLALVGIILVSVFAIMFGYVCGFDDGLVRGLQVGPGIDWIPSVDGLLNFVAAIYFSLVTFTGLGYGDIHPVNALGRVLAGMEVVLGFVTMSLVLVTIVRRWSR